MKKIKLILIIILTIVSNINAQNEVKKLGPGFALTTFGAINRGKTENPYYVIYNDNDNYNNFKNYPLENAFGYNYGVGLNIHGGSHYAFEIPITFSADRFFVPIISNSALKVSSVEIGMSHYLKFLKEKHYIVMGIHVGGILNGFESTTTFGYDFGYGYNFTKRLNMSLRYKLNMNNNYYTNNSAIEINNFNENDLNSFTLTSNYNSIQLVMRFDIINTRKLITNKIETNKNKYISPQNITTTPVVVPQKVEVDYSKYTDTLLEQTFKNAKSITEMQLIQKEKDNRKLIQNQKKEQVNEYEKYNKKQLNELINDAVAIEDFTKAEKLQTELNKRKKAVEELQKSIEEAVKIEDFEKAAKLQEKINYLER
jgi:hypothetical protein